MAEHGRDLLVGGSLGETLHENIIAGSRLPLGVLLVLAAHMEHDLHGLATELGPVGLADSCLSVFLILELNESVATGGVISETLQFTLLNSAILDKVVVNLLLRQLGSQVAHHNVGFRVGLCVHLQRPRGHLAVDLVVVHSFLAAECFLLGGELGVAVIEGLISFPIKHHKGLDNVVSLSLDKLEQVKVVELSGQVSDVQRGQALLLRLLLALAVVLLRVLVAHKLLHAVE